MTTAAASAEALPSANHTQQKPTSQASSPHWQANIKTAQYGSKLSSIRTANEILCHRQFSIPANVEASKVPGLRLVSAASSRNSETHSRKRLCTELRHIINDGVEGVSLAPIADNIYHLIACIEGPPDTPYEDGIFWIDIHIPELYPWQPPKMRFVTRVYHPNIDCRGQICVEFLEQGGTWSPAYLLQTALLAIVSLLAHPTLEDVQEPLVPEIAQIYLEDYELYCENARKYTQLYAREMSPPEISE